MRVKNLYPYCLPILTRVLDFLGCLFGAACSLDEGKGYPNKLLNPNLSLFKCATLRASHVGLRASCIILRLSQIVLGANYTYFASRVLKCPGGRFQHVTNG